jgi:hypothetical protein
MVKDTPSLKPWWIQNLFPPRCHAASSKKIGLTRARQYKFRTIDSDLIKRPIGWVKVNLDVASGIKRVVFGEPKDGTVLGSIPMDLGIKIDPQPGQYQGKMSS